MAATTRIWFAQHYLLPAIGVTYGPSRLGARRFLAGTWPHAETGEKPGLCNGKPGEGAKWNPFNTTLQLPGSTFYNTLAPGVGVQNYVSAEQGAQAFARTLTGDVRYGPFFDLLRKRWVKQADLIEALDASPWGTHEPLLDYAFQAYMAHRGFYNYYPIGA